MGLLRVHEVRIEFFLVLYIKMLHFSRRLYSDTSLISLSPFSAAWFRIVQTVVVLTLIVNIVVVGMLSFYLVDRFRIKYYNPNRYRAFTTNSVLMFVSGKFTYLLHNKHCYFCPSQRCSVINQLQAWKLWRNLQWPLPCFDCGLYLQVCSCWLLRWCSQWRPRTLPGCPALGWIICPGPTVFLSSLDSLPFSPESHSL